MAVESQQRAGVSDPHAGQPAVTAGPKPHVADAGLGLLHGRGSTAESILSLHTQMGLPTVAAIAPQAAGYSWYPRSFLTPVEANQPFLDSALRRIEAIIDGLLDSGVPSDKIAL